MRSFFTEQCPSFLVATTDYFTTEENGNGLDLKLNPLAWQQNKSSLGGNSQDV